MAVASSALKANQARMRVIAENLANANSTSRVAGGDPYRRQVPVLEPDGKVAPGADGVRVAAVRADMRDFRMVHDPGHPAADAQGYVKMPNVDSLVEALDMREAQRAYEANLNVIETARAMDSRTLDLLRK
ncbi:MAG: flagellar basal body rod protein FlgC [Proteobacteria bacterium]|nr:flagellar basal body rod protein FlgC [Pseudomonadota bacterium]MBW3617370.1 flagellar basal body rod protein FlgC [Pseudomonadota bacterium]